MRVTTRLISPGLTKNSNMLGEAPREPSPQDRRSLGGEEVPAKQRFKPRVNRRLRAEAREHDAEEQA